MHNTYSTDQATTIQEQVDICWNQHALRRATSRLFAIARTLRAAEQHAQRAIDDEAAIAAAEQVVREILPGVTLVA